MRLAASGLVLNLAAVVAAALAAGYTAERKREVNLPADAKDLELRIGWRDWQGAPLYPEQSAEFHLELVNRSQAAQTVVDLQNNIFTPVLQLYDARGAALGRYDPYARKQRLVGDMSRRSIGPPLTSTLPPGKAMSDDHNLWTYSPPLPAGNYAVAATHRVAEGVDVTSNRLPFSVVDARVESAAAGYDSALRSATVTAWLAADGSPGKSPRLLVRQSALTGYGMAGQGATPCGDFPHGARVAVGGYAPGAPLTRQGWVAVVWDGRAELIRHAFTSPQWRSGAFGFPLAEPVPVPRFPDRGHAVFLATGKTRDGFALAGAVVHAGAAAPPKPWLVRLAEEPKLAACAFGMEQPIALLLAADNGKQARLIRLDVWENGKVAVAARTVYTTPNEVLALAVTSEADAFMALEGGRRLPDRLAMVRLPLQGPPAAGEPHPMPGWPVAPAARALRAVQLQLEAAPGGGLWIALVDEQGAFRAGPAGGSLAKLRDGAGSPALFPHVSANFRNLTLACFTSRGRLFFGGQSER